MSINLLPQKEKKHVKGIYRSRRTAAASWFFVALIVISIISLVPLYLLGQNIEILSESKKSQLQEESSDFDIEEIEDRIYTINKKTQTLARSNDHARVYPRIVNITENKRSGISISGIAFREREEGEVIEIVGVANTRDTLLAFRRDLEQKEYSKAVELPVSNFAQNMDIDFSIRVILQENE